MSDWLFLFRPETWEAAQTYGLVGVLSAHAKRLQAVAPGDRFVAYVSRKGVLDGWGTFTSGAFSEVAREPIGWVRYTERARFRVGQTGLAVPGREALWGLNFVGPNPKTEPTNLLFCKGGFVPLSEGEFDWLVNVVIAKGGVMGEMPTPSAPPSAPPSAGPTAKPPLGESGTG